MANAIENFLEKANEKDNDKNFFSETDLKEFTDLVKTQDDFDSLLTGFESKETKTKMVDLGVLDSVKAFVETKKGLASIFEKEYKDLEDNQDLYEVCRLGALLEGKTSPKEYYESVTTKTESKIEEKKEDIAGTYDTALSEMKTETKTQIETTTTIEAGKNITEASVSISAGADLRKMNLEKAKKDRSDKVATLTEIKLKFNTDNQAIIQTILDELSVANIESKIKDVGTNKTDNAEQHGNRYLVGARLAEGFIQALDRLIIVPEPKLTLGIDWSNCIIGVSAKKADVEADRFIRMDLNLKVETTEEKKDENKDKKDDEKKDEKKDEEKETKPTSKDERDEKPEVKSVEKKEEKKDEKEETKSASKDERDEKPEVKPAEKKEEKKDEEKEAKPASKDERDEKSEAKSDVKPDVKPDMESKTNNDNGNDSKFDVKPDIKPDVKTIIQPIVKPDIKQTTEITDNTTEKMNKMDIESAKIAFQSYYNLENFENPNTVNFSENPNKIGYLIQGKINNVDVEITFSLDKNKKVKDLLLSKPENGYMFDISKKAGDKIILNLQENTEEQRKDKTNEMIDKALAMIDDYTSFRKDEVEIDSENEKMRADLADEQIKYKAFQVTTANKKEFEAKNKKLLETCDEIKEMIKEKTTATLTSYLDKHFLEDIGLSRIKLRDEVHSYLVKKGELKPKNLKDIYAITINDKKYIDKIFFDRLPGLSQIIIPKKAKEIIDENMIEDLMKKPGLASIKTIVIGEKQEKKITKGTKESDSTFRERVKKEITPLTPPKQNENFTLEKMNNKLSLNGVKLEDVINRIKAIPNEKTRIEIQNKLVEGKVEEVQTYVGMKKDSDYADNDANGIVDKNTLDRLTNPLFGLEGDELLNNKFIPTDVKNKYKEFQKGLNEGRNYAIVSKSDFKIYVFSKENRLISVHTVGLGLTKGEHPNEAYKDKSKSTTPGGMYTVDNRIVDQKQYAGPGDYVALFPNEGQYDVNNSKGFTLGFHNYYKARGNSLKDRISSGCVNTYSEGSIYDNLVIGSKFFITREP